MPNAGNLQSRAGQTYHLPPVALRGYISTRYTNYRNNRDHKISIGIPNNNHLYGEWQEAVKNQMLARGIRKILTFPDQHFQQIVGDMRTLRPACDSLVTAVATNNRARMRQIDEPVVQLVKDCGVKLRTTVKNRSTGLAPLGKHGTLYDQMMLRDRLLSPNTPDQWGPAMTVRNLGPVSQNVSPAYPPQAQNVPPHHGNYLPPAPGVLVQGVPNTLIRSLRRKVSWGKVSRRKTYLIITRITPLQSKMYLLIMGITSLRCKVCRCKRYLIITGITALLGKTYLHLLRFTLLLVKTYWAFLGITLIRLKMHLPFPPITLMLIH